MATTESLRDVTGEIIRLFEVEPAEVCLHARDIDGDAEFGISDDRPVVAASTFKVAVALELGRQAAEGGLALTDRARVTSENRTTGLAAGLCAMLDDAELSVRDLAYLMMAVSDNTATDLIIERVGLDRINATLRALGLTRTVLTDTIESMIQMYMEDMGAAYADYDEDRHGGAGKPEMDPEALRRTRLLDPAQTTRTTPAEMTRLLQLVWTDEAGSPDACAEVRRLMALQCAGEDLKRLATGFDDSVKVSGKTGTLAGLRNEVGVVEFPDGPRFAVAVYTRPQSLDIRLPELDLAIGRAAAVAVEHLRQR